MNIIDEVTELYKRYGVDEAKLSRNYKTDPIKKEGVRNLIAKPDRNDLKYFYSELGMKGIEIGIIFGGFSAPSVLDYIKKYELPKPNNKENRKTSIDTVKEKYVCVLLKDNDNNILYYGIKTPLVKKDDVNQDIVINSNDFIQKYINENLSVEEMEKFFNISNSCVVSFRKALNLHKDPKKAKENYRKTMKEKYGCVNCFQLEEIKQKSEETMKQKYGMRFQKTQAYRDKVFNTKLERYGNGKYQNFEKYYETNMKKYGVPNPNMKKGKDWLYKMLKADDTTELINYIKQKNYQNIKDFANHEGMKINTIGDAIRKFNLHYLFPNKRSALEIEIQEWIAQYDDNLKTSLKMPNNREIDIYDDKRMLGFEVNGTLWHSGKYHDKNYHYEKTVEAESIGYRLIHIFEYEWVARRKQIQGLIKDILGVFNHQVSYLDCYIKEPTFEETDEFLNDNAVYIDENYDKSVGLYFKNKLLAVITFQKNGLNSYMVTNYCKKLGYFIENWFVQMCGRFIFDNKPEVLYGFSDNSKSNGNEFSRIGFKKMSFVSPIRKYFKYKTVIDEPEITYAVLKNHNVKFPIGIEKYLTAEEVLRYKCYDEVYDCGKTKWVWKFTKK